MEPFEKYYFSSDDWHFMLQCFHLVLSEWSAPSAIGIAGLGGGFEIGIEVSGPSAPLLDTQRLPKPSTMLTKALRALTLLLTPVEGCFPLPSALLSSLPFCELVCLWSSLQTVVYIQDNINTEPLSSAFPGFICSVYSALEP